MSPVAAARDVDSRRFPRVSGDEPMPSLTMPTTMAFSPREWG